MDMREVQSSHIHSCGYDPVTRTLRVKYRERLGKGGVPVPGATVEYPDFDEVDHDSLMAVASDPNQSLGSHIYKHVRFMLDGSPRPYRKVEE